MIESKMPDIKTRIATADWQEITTQLHGHGYALLPAFLNNDECAALIGVYNDGQHYRKTVNMERYRFGRGEYKYFTYPLPPLIQQIREFVYPHIAKVANTWMEVLNLEESFPDNFTELQQRCHEYGQDKPTALILKYGSGGYNTLHQDLYGEVYFPLQLVLFLNDPEKDYTGGEFVLIEQTPRAQSRAIVLKPKLGDMLIFTTNFRPVKGSRGYYRVNMKHGVSEVLSGQRHTLGIIFHDALS